MSKKVKKTTTFNKTVKVQEYNTEELSLSYSKNIKEEQDLKRKLTNDEIEYCLDFIVPSQGIPRDVALGISEKNKKNLRKQLEKVEIYPSLISKLRNEMRTTYYKTLIQPGESVGVATAQSIGERQTQQTLNTFHSAGSAIKTVITGVPRFSELLNATKEPKARSTQMFFTQNNDSISSLRNLVGNKIREFRLKDLIKGYTTHSNKEREEWYDIFDSVYSKKYNEMTECISYNFNKELLYEYKIPLRIVSEMLENKVKDIVCVFSPNHIAKMDVYVDMSEIELLEDMTEEEAYEYHLRQNSIPYLNEVVICGISGVENIFFEKKDEEWIMETEGSNFKELLGLPFVDKVRTISNDMWEIYDTLGIEAARNFLVEEFGSVVSSDGTFVNQSHILLLVDSMTFHGTITAISRYGHKKENCGPMAKASFEESLENFLKAGINGEKETTNGVSASIMLGKVPKVGTGLCDVLVDIKGLPGCVPVLGEVKEK
jgi:DNA-directed RNA polymerase II subunit RPB1